MRSFVRSGQTFSPGEPVSTRIVFCLSFLLAASSMALNCEAQLPSHHTSGVPTIPALMISDIHFDPFHDPGKVQQLVDAPASRWNSILGAPASPDQQRTFDGLQETCKSRGEDTSYALLRASLRAMRRQAPDAKFMTVTGDLIAHDFQCRFRTLLPRTTQSDYQEFVLKTIEFVMLELRGDLPDMPIYTALGNNDTACGDYQLDPHSAFLARAGKLIAVAIPAAEQQSATQQFVEGGYYSVRMAAPMRDTRIIVLNDLLLSPKNKSCSGTSNAEAANTEMLWLGEQLTAAQQAGQRVWVIGHIPPGVDPFSTVAKMKNICGGAAPVLFLDSDAMADLLIQHAMTVRLAVFAHTHMDELRLLASQGGDATASAEHSVALKMVPSISPVDGNNPSFTIARVDPSTAVLTDYEVIAAASPSGDKWASEYDFASTYHESQFSPANLRHLIGEFQADHSAQQPMSQAYIRSYFIGDRSSELTPFWQPYVCALANSTAQSYASCVCKTNK